MSEEQHEQNTPDPQTDNSEQSTLSADEVKLIGETIEAIKEKLGEKLEDTYITVGKLIINKLYKDDCNATDFSEKSKTAKGEIFRQLASEIENQAKTGAVLPKKTWLYNSVRLAMDNTLLEESENYKKLTISHKIELLSLESKEDKIKAIDKIASEKLSVRDTRKLVYIKAPSTKRDLLFFIKKPERIKNLDTFLSAEIEKYLPDQESIQAATEACKDHLKDIDKEIAKYTERKRKLKALQEQLGKPLKVEDPSTVPDVGKD